MSTINDTKQHKCQKLYLRVRHILLMITMDDDGKNNSDESSVKKNREKSVRYPANTLEECVEFLKMVHAIGGRKEAPIESVLSKMNVTTPDNRRYKYLTSSAEIFGLIKKTKSGISPTEFGTSIVYPLGGEEHRKTLILEAFHNPPVYQKIIERYSGTILPDIKTLKAVFYNYHIATNALDTAINAFIASAKYAGALDQNNRLLSSSQEVEHQIPPNEEKQSEDKPKEPEVPSPKKTNTAQNRSEKPDLDGYKFEIPTSSGDKASISLPKDWRNEDIELLIKLLRALCPEVKT